MERPLLSESLAKVTFDDAAIYFSEEQWQNLEDFQKKIYKELIKEIYETMLALGYRIPKPEIVCRIERGEEPCIDMCKKPKLQGSQPEGVPAGSKDSEPVIKVERESPEASVLYHPSEISSSQERSGTQCPRCGTCCNNQCGVGFQWNAQGMYTVPPMDRNHGKQYVTSPPSYYNGNPISPGFTNRGDGMSHTTSPRAAYGNVGMVPLSPHYAGYRNPGDPSTQFPMPERSGNPMFVNYDVNQQTAMGPPGSHIDHDNRARKDQYPHARDASFQERRNAMNPCPHCGAFCNNQCVMSFQWEQRRLHHMAPGPMDGVQGNRYASPPNPYFNGGANSAAFQNVRPPVRHGTPPVNVQGNPAMIQLSPQYAGYRRPGDTKSPNVMPGKMDHSAGNVGHVSNTTASSPHGPNQGNKYGSVPANSNAYHRKAQSMSPLAAIETMPMFTTNNNPSNVHEQRNRPSAQTVTSSDGNRDRSTMPPNTNRRPDNTHYSNQGNRVNRGQIHSNTPATGNTGQPKPGEAAGNKTSSPSVSVGHTAKNTQPSSSTLIGQDVGRMAASESYGVKRAAPQGASDSGLPPKRASPPVIIVDCQGGKGTSTPTSGGNSQGSACATPPTTRPGSLPSAPVMVGGSQDPRRTTPQESKDNRRPTPPITISNIRSAGIFVHPSARAKKDLNNASSPIIIIDDKDYDVPVRRSSPANASNNEVKHSNSGTPPVTNPKNSGAPSPSSFNKVHLQGGQQGHLQGGQQGHLQGGQQGHLQGGQQGHLQVGQQGHLQVGQQGHLQVGQQGHLQVGQQGHLQGGQQGHLQGGQQGHLQGGQQGHLQGGQQGHLQGGQQGHLQGGQQGHLQGGQQGHLQGGQQGHLQGGQQGHLQGGQQSHLQGGQQGHLQGGQQGHLHGGQQGHLQGGQQGHLQGGQQGHLQGGQQGHLQGGQQGHLQGGQQGHLQGGQQGHLQGGQQVHLQGGQQVHLQGGQQVHLQGGQQVHLQGGQQGHPQGGQQGHPQGGQQGHLQGGQQGHPQGGQQGHPQGGQQGHPQGGQQGHPQAGQQGHPQGGQQGHPQGGQQGHPQGGQQGHPQGGQQGAQVLVNKLQVQQSSPIIVTGGNQSLPVSVNGNRSIMLTFPVTVGNSGIMLATPLNIAEKQIPPIKPTNRVPISKNPRLPLNTTAGNVNTKFGPMTVTSVIGQTNTLPVSVPPGQAKPITVNINQSGNTLNIKNSNLQKVNAGTLKAVPVTASGNQTIPIFVDANSGLILTGSAVPSKDNVPSGIGNATVVTVNGGVVTGNVAPVSLGGKLAFRNITPVNVNGLGNTTFFTVDRAMGIGNSSPVTLTSNGTNFHNKGTLSINNPTILTVNGGLGIGNTGAVGAAVANITSVNANGTLQVAPTAAPTVVGGASQQNNGILIRRVGEPGAAPQQPNTEQSAVVVERLFKCSDCGEKFNSLENLTSHQVVHKPSNATPDGKASEPTPKDSDVLPADEDAPTILYTTQGDDGSTVYVVTV